MKLEQKLKEIKKNTTQFLAKNPDDQNRKAKMAQATMEPLQAPGTKDIKQVEMTKFKKSVPESFKENTIYKTPDSKITQQIKDQKNAKVRERNSKKKKAKLEETEKEEGSSKEGFI
jgi:hypothetical protein